VDYALDGPLNNCMAFFGLSGSDMQRKRAVMKSILLVLAAVSLSAYGQEPHKCKVGGGFVYQDSPCKVQVLPPATSRTEAPTVAATADSQTKLERDKAYLADRAYARQKTESADAVKACDAEAQSIQYELDSVATEPDLDRGGSIRGIAAMQLDQERKQSRMVGLQSRVTAKRHECDTLRQAHSAKYK